MKNITKSIVIATMSVVLLGISHCSFAQILIEDARVSLEIKPDSTVVDKLRVHNTSNTAIELKVYWQDFQYIAPYDGAKKFMPGGTAPYSFSDWISFSPQSLRIPPYGMKEINYTIKVPKIVKGGHQGVLFLETNPSKAEGDIGLSIVTRVGAIFFLRTAGEPKTAKFSDLKVATGKFQGIFQNESSLTLFPEAIYYVLDESGIVVDRGEIKKTYLPSGENIKLDIPVSGKIKAGEFTIVVTFDLEDGDSLVKEFDFLKGKDNKLQITRVRD